MKLSVSKCLTLAILSLALSACGFQLRGTGDDSKLLPEGWKRLYLDTANPHSELSRAITSQFAASGVQWVERSSANYILAVQPERFEQDNLSISSDARAAEYELTLSTEFTVRETGSNSTAMPDTRIAVLKLMDNDPRNVVGKEEEIRLLKREMRGELARKMLRRMGFYASRRPAEPSATQ